MENKKIPSEKKCSKCKEVKPLDAFCQKADRKDGRNSHCRACDSKRRASLAKPKREVKQGEKVCYTCKELRPFSEFARNTARADMMAHECKACEKARRMERKAKDINYAAFYLPVNYY